MAGYKPLKITGNQTGLVQQREEFLLPDDAYPQLLNAYVWRERIRRKKGYELLGRLRRNLTNQSLGDTVTTGVQFNIFSLINLSGSISGITQANPGEVTTTAPHFLQTGQFVTITNVAGMTEVNGKTYQVIVTGASTFTIVDTSSFTAYTSGGDWQTNNTTIQTNKSIIPGTVVTVVNSTVIFTDNGDGPLS